MTDFPRLPDQTQKFSHRTRRQELEDIRPFLLTLGRYVKIDEVEFGADPPDFVFRHGSGSIGVELTKLNPRVFDAGGYEARGAFKSWKKEVAASMKLRDEFNRWGGFSVRESLAAFEQQLKNKSNDISRWKGTVDEKWLLVHIDSGSPFGELVANQTNVVRGCGSEWADYCAKLVCCLSTICQKSPAFECVVLFSGCVLFSFPTGGKNPHRFPTASPEILARGEKASDRFLDWTGSSRSVSKQVTIREAMSWGKANWKRFEK